MKKALFIISILLVAVVTTACINNIAVQELNNKASEFMAKGDYENAISRLQSSIDLENSIYQTHYNLGIAYTKAEKYEEAIQAFNNGLELKPDYPDFYYSIAAAQISWADKLLEDTEEENPKENKVVLTKEERTQKAYVLRNSALDNLKKYIEMDIDKEDKENAQSLIEDTEKLINGENNN